MKFLITGAAGFIGSHLADRLLAAGHDVWGIDNHVTGRRDNFPHDEPRAVLFDGDIINRARFYACANDFEPDVVVHCAASYSDPNLWHRDTDTNIAGTINATLVAKHHGARLVYFQTALPPISSYAISKIAGEQYINLSGVPSLIFRLANIYGPRNLSGPIPTFYKRLTAKQECTVVDTERDMVYIDDLISGVVRAIDKGVTGKFDMCSGMHIPIADLFHSVGLALGIRALRTDTVPAAVDDVKQMELDPARVALDLEWMASTGLRSGVAKAVDWYREHGVDNTYTHLSLKG